MKPVVRALTLLQHLISQGGSLSTSEAANLLGIDKEAVRRDFENLEESGWIRPLGEGRDRRWHLRHETAVDKLGTFDQISLRFGRDLASFLQGTGLAKGVERASGQLDQRRTSVQDLDRKFVVHGEPARSYTSKEDEIDEIVDALCRGRRLRFVYRSRNREPRDYDVEPLTLVLYRRAVYLLCREPGAARVNRFPVDRIESVVGGEPFDYPPADRWDPAEVLDPWFGITADNAADANVQIRFSAEVAELVRARKWHSTARIFDEPDGTVLLAMKCTGPELGRFVLEWGEHAEVLSPGWLRERVVRELEGALGRYRRSP